MGVQADIDAPMPSQVSDVNIFGDLYPFKTNKFYTPKHLQLQVSLDVFGFDLEIHVLELTMHSARRRN